MKTLLAVLVATLALAGSASAAPHGGQANVSGTVLFVPNNMMCIPGRVCNAYRGPVIFCRSFPGMMATAVPCRTPAASTQTSSTGRFGVALPAGMYTIYVRGIKKPWVLTGVALKPGANTVAITLSRFRD